jgi:hypothetical protein
VAFIPMSFDFYKMGQWEKESLEYTDQFIELLAEEKYNEMRILYDISGDNIEEFKSKFGEISEYTYGFTNSSKSGTYGQYTGFFMHYIIKFHSDEFYQGTFSIRIDDNDNKPIPGDIEDFTVRGREIDRKNFFYINISKKDLPNLALSADAKSRAR